MTLGMAFAWLIGFVATVGVIMWKAVRQSRSWNDLTTSPGSVERDLRRQSMENVDDSDGVRPDGIVGRESEGRGPSLAADPSADPPSVPLDAA